MTVAGPTLRIQTTRDEALALVAEVNAA